MIKWIKKWIITKNEISYVHVVYWFDYKSEKRRNLAFRDKEEAINFMHELRNGDPENHHKFDIMIDTIELL